MGLCRGWSTPWPVDEIEWSIKMVAPPTNSQTWLRPGKSTELASDIAGVASGRLMGHSVEKYLDPKRIRRTIINIKICSIWFGGEITWKHFLVQLKNRPAMTLAWDTYSRSCRPSGWATCLPLVAMFIVVQLLHTMAASSKNWPCLAFSTVVNASLGKDVNWWKR